MARFAFFVSSHGFGHAARAGAVIEALRRRLPDSRFALFTAVAPWFFDDTLSSPVDGYHRVRDLGLVQTTALDEDVGATLSALEKSLPFAESRLDELGALVDEFAADVVLCDIAPIGLAVARRCGRRSVLIENFTWDWIYGAYVGECPGLSPLADYLAEIFAGADHRVQAEPFCEAAEGGVPVPPVSRRPRLGRAEVRRRLGVPGDAPLVLVTMGGVEWDYRGLESPVSGSEDLPWLVIPGGSSEPRTFGRVVALPHRSSFFHPDLVGAVDAVIGKLGYSTVAEVYRAGVPFGYLTRPRFPESPKLEAWVGEHLPSQRLDRVASSTAEWLEAAAPLLEMAPRPASRPDGADVVAGHIAAWLD